MRLELGSLVPALSGWTLCIDEAECDCTICVYLPGWAENLGEHGKAYLALYLASRRLLDYRLAAAMHVYMMKNRVVLRPEALVGALRESRVVSRVPRAVEEDSTYAWEAVLCRGMLYAEQILSLGKPVVVRVKPPRDKREREKLRVLLEGKRVTVRGRTYRVGGLVKKLGGEKIAPWVYLVPRKSIPALRETLTASSSMVEVV